MFETGLSLIGGLVLLVAGGELLMRGAVQVATRLGVSPLVIGLTLVGFGTSAPELVTSVQAALSGRPPSPLWAPFILWGIWVNRTTSPVPSSILRRTKSSS